MDKRSSIARQLATLKNRDEVIRAAYREYGMTKQEIHELSGIARTTIDRILKEKTVAVPVHQVTAATTEAGPEWTRSISAWTEAAREAGHNAQDTGETKPGNHRPVILVNGDRYTLNRHSDPAVGHTIVTAEKET